MDINIHSIHFDADEKLLDFVNSKLGKLSTFFDKIIDAEVFLRLDKSNTNENKLVEIKVNLPGKELFAKKQSKSFEESTDEVVEALRRQIKKHKEKLVEL
jgi:putative sigma-54 modulation protein